MEENREPAPCSVCGEVHIDCSQAIIDGMYLMAYLEAKQRLSEEGMEALQMVTHAVDALGVEAWDMAENVENLPVEEVRIIEVFLARKTLIDAAREELYEEERNGEEEA